MKTIITTDDLFIFELLSATETAELMQWIALYWQECEQEHNPMFIDRITDRAVKAAFTYFNNKWKRRRKKIVKPASAPMPVHPDNEPVLPDYLQLKPFYPFTSYDAFNPSFLEREKLKAKERGDDLSRWPIDSDIKEFYSYWNDFRSRNPEFEKAFLARDL